MKGGVPMHINNNVEKSTNSAKNDDKPKINKPTIVDPMPESTRPRQDGPGGN